MYSYQIVQNVFESPFHVLVFIIILFITYLFIRNRADSYGNLPPTPWNLPLVGSFPWLLLSFKRSRLSAFEFLRRLKYTYGNVYAFNFFGQLVVFVNDFQATKEAFNNPCLSDKPKMRLKKLDTGGRKGIVLASGEMWHRQRSFTQLAFRDFGVGKNTFEAKIANESHELIQEITSLKGAAFDPKQLLLDAVSNIICSVVFGKRFKYSDERFRHLVRLTTRQTELSVRNLPFLFLPVFYYFPTKGVYELESNGLQLQNFADDIIQEHQSSFDPEHLRDYIDVYIKELRLNDEVNSGKLSGCNEDNMKQTISQLFTAGSDTTSLTLRWGLLFMISNAEVQARVQREIDEVVGRNRLPKISDKPFLPYTQATLLEIQRMASVSRLSVFHTCSQTTSLCGYKIPKGSIVIGNLWAIHHDPELWPDPQTFKPERFLDQQTGELRRFEELIPFSIGRRTCLGDSLAKMELYIFFTHLLHQFTFKISSNSDDISTVDQGRCPKEFKLCAEKRP